MPTTKVGSTLASQSRIVPLLVPAEAMAKHQIRQNAAPKKEYSVNFHAAKTLENPLRSSQSVNRKFEIQKHLLSFCPTCQMLLRAVESCPSSLRCKKCGYRVKLNGLVREGKAHASRQHLDEIVVIDKKKANLRTYPIVHAICEKCGKTESETWTVAVGSEGTTSALTFLRCIHCGFTRREVG